MRNEHNLGQEVSCKVENVRSSDDRLANQLQWCEDRRKGIPLPVIAWKDELRPIPPAKASERPKGFAYVYIIQAGDFVKIGIAEDIARRMRAMQTGCPFKLELLRCWPSATPKRLERRLHFKLREYHHRGEWFKIPEHVIDGLSVGH